LPGYPFQTEPSGIWQVGLLVTEDFACDWIECQRVDYLITVIVVVGAMLMICPYQLVGSLLF
jgi:hypothetical protein